MLSEYEKDKPKILGGFLDVIVKALNEYSKVKTKKLFRLADFTQWGCALAVALGKTEDDFILALEENQKSQNAADIEQTPVVDAFLQYCEENHEARTRENPFSASPDEVFSNVKEKAEKLHISIKSKKFPASACYFTRRLNESKNAIIGAGWDYEVVPKGATRAMNVWHVKKLTSHEGAKKKEAEAQKPFFRCFKLPPNAKAEKCDCGEFAVGFRIETPFSGTILKCEGCKVALKRKIVLAEWVEPSHEQTDFHDKEYREEA